MNTVNWDTGKFKKRKRFDTSISQKGVNWDKTKPPCHIHGTGKNSALCNRTQIPDLTRLLNVKDSDLKGMNKGKGVAGHSLRE